jgi:hypothetical protein
MMAQSHRINQLLAVVVALIAEGMAVGVGVVVGLAGAIALLLVTR